jgi:hypothetical protein
VLQIILVKTPLARLAAQIDQRARP